MDELHERLIDLEIRYTHQVQLLEELNLVVTDACKRIARLEAENRTLRDQVRRLHVEDLTLSPDE